MGYNSIAEGSFIFEGITDEKLGSLNQEFLEGVSKSAMRGEWFYFQPSFRVEGDKIIAYAGCDGKLYDLDEEIETVVSAIVKATGATNVTGHIMRTGEETGDLELYYVARTTPIVRVESARAKSIVFSNGTTVPLR